MSLEGEMKVVCNCSSRHCAPTCVHDNPHEEGDTCYWPTNCIYCKEKVRCIPVNVSATAN